MRLLIADGLVILRLDWRRGYRDFFCRVWVKNQRGRLIDGKIEGAVNQVHDDFSGGTGTNLTLLSSPPTLKVRVIGVLFAG